MMRRPPEYDDLGVKPPTVVPEGGLLRKPRTRRIAQSNGASNGASNGHRVEQESEQEREEVTIEGGVLMQTEIAPLRYVCRPWIVEGLLVLAGSPKLGKTTLLRQLAHAASCGQPFFGSPCEPADVLFLSLEEGKRLMHLKLCKMGYPQTEFTHIEFAFAWACGGDGAAHLRKWIGLHETERQRIVVIDSLTRFRDMPDPRTPAFQQDYLALRMLADICKEFSGLIMIVLHHTTKAVADNPIANISGTNGIVAATDNYWVVQQIGEHYRLHCGGRMWEGEESDYEVVRSNGGWDLLGSWQPGFEQTTVHQRAVLDVLATGAKTRNGIAEALGIEDATKVSHLLRKLEQGGLVKRIAGGWMLDR